MVTISLVFVQSPGVKKRLCILVDKFPDFLLKEVGDKEEIKKGWKYFPEMSFGISVMGDSVPAGKKSVSFLFLFGSSRNALTVDTVKTKEFRENCYWVFGRKLED